MSTASGQSFAHLGEPVPTLRPRTHYGRWVAVIVLLVVGAGIAYSLDGNKNLDVPTVRYYLFYPAVLQGVVVTIELTAICFALGLIGGLLLAVMRLSPNRVLSAMALVYVWIFRSVPPLLQLIFWGFFAALYPQLKLGVPFTTITFLSANTNSILSPFAAAILGLTFIEIAYAAEVIRGGIAGVEYGQSLAAHALGMNNSTTLRKIILPQAMPAMVPPLGNNLIDLLKGTSLVSVIGGAELMTQVQRIYSQSFNVIPLLCVAAIWYLALTAVIAVFQAAIERHYSRGKLQGRVRQPKKVASVTL